MARSPLLRISALLLALLLAACSAAPPAAAPTSPASTDSQSAPDAPGSGGTLTVGRTAAPDSLNPGSGYVTESFDIWFLVYDTLIYTDLRNQPHPLLASEWSVGEDGRTWTFKLREGTRWHDGTPLTAEDVVFTFEMLRDFESFGLFKVYADLLASAEALDASTVVLTFSEPVADTDERFSGVPILPRHIWRALGDEQAVLEYENTDMIGSGPFKMAEYVPGQFTRLEAVKDHYFDPPTIDEVIFRVFGNGDAMVQALRIGEIDLMEVPSNTVVRSLQSETNIQVEVGAQAALTDIFFNVVTAENCPPEDGVCSGHPALQDVRVRQAIAHATDKQQLIDVVLLGLGRPGLSLVTPAQGEGYAGQLADYAYDVARANAILDEAGYLDSDNDGVREMPGDPATPLRFRYSYPSDQSQNGARLFELLSAMWQQAGIAIELTPLESDALTAICCPAFDFDIINWGWGAGVDPASLLYIATTAEIPTGVSEAGYSNPEYDALYEQQRSTVDRAERIALLHQMQEILLRDMPYLIPYYPDNVEAYRKDRFTSFVTDPEGILSLDGRISLTKVRPVQ